MNYRQAILDTLSGKPTEAVPFVPRLDIWYKANRYAGTLPEQYKNARLCDITDDLGVGYHAVVPDFRDYADGDGDMDLGLGIYRFRAIPYTVCLHDVRRSVTRSGGLTTVEYETPYGRITTRVLYDEGMKRDGSTLAHVVEYAVKSVKDFKAAAYIFSHAEVRPDYTGYEALRDSVGDRGVAVAFSSLGASPMHYIFKELMRADTFFYESLDWPDELEEFAEGISGYYDKAFKVAAESPADIVLSGGNYDASITSPPFFEKHVLPSLKRQADDLHARGKYLLTHTDGENRGLLDLYLKSGFDIADSICPEPMTHLSLKQVKEAFDGKITIWGGIPSVAVLEETMENTEFENYVETLLGSIGRGDRMIFSIADTCPPGAKIDRIRHLARRIRQFGPVNPG